MIDLSFSLYLWIKAFHIIAVISWMAGLLYLPRLFVYHSAVDAYSDQSETFKTMERRLLRVIMNPAMVISLVLGLILIANSYPEITFDGWFHIKMLGVIGLIVVHMKLAKIRKNFELNINKHSHKYFRYLNEIPTVLMVIVVIMVIVRPF